MAKNGAALSFVEDWPEREATIIRAATRELAGIAT
jgi:hypothetical protein